jgi:hypothetical protein
MPATDAEYVTHSEFSTYVAEQRAFNVRLLDKIDDLNKTKPVNWGWVISALICLGAFITLYVRPLEKMVMELDSDIGANTSSLIAHMSDGHPKRVEERVLALDNVVQNLEGNIDDVRSDWATGLKQFDETLQREMRLLDEVLQREMGLHVQRLSEQIAALDGTVKEISAEQRRRTDRVYE